MTEGPVGSSLIRLSVPMMFGLISIMLFSLVDTFYISLIGVRELVAISFTFPVTFTLMSFSFGIGIGASVVISRAIGEGDQHRVRRLTTDSLLLVSLIIICVAAISFFFTRNYIHSYWSNKRIDSANQRIHGSMVGGSGFCGDTHCWKQCNSRNWRY